MELVGSVFLLVGAAICMLVAISVGLRRKGESVPVRCGCDFSWHRRSGLVYPVSEDGWEKCFYEAHRLPCCGGTTWYEGAEGGMTTNIECCACGQKWNVSLCGLDNGQMPRFIEKIGA